MRMNIRQIARTSLLAALLAPVAPHLASADAIDGEWCKGTSHFTIDGPNILTPGGNRIQGNYTRQRRQRDQHAAAQRGECPADPARAILAAGVLAALPPDELRGEGQIRQYSIPTEFVRSRQQWGWQLSLEAVSDSRIALRRFV
jgi:hypothetical protein